MGLVVQPTQDPVLNLLAPQAPAGDAPGVPDAFQALLAELLGAAGTDAPADGTNDAAPAPPLPAPPKGDDAKTGDGSSPAAALFAALAQLQPLAPQLATLPSTAPSGRAEKVPTADPAVTGIGTNALNPQPQAPTNLAPEAQLPDAANSEPAVGNTGDPDASSVTTSAVPQPAPVIAEPTANQAKTSQPATAGTTEPPQAQAIAAMLDNRPTSGGRADRAKAPPGELREAPPAAGPPSAAATAASNSVVRSVGNANEEATTDSQTPAQDPAQPQPRSSLAGGFARGQAEVAADPSAPRVPARPGLLAPASARANARDWDTANTPVEPQGGLPQAPATNVGASIAEATPPSTPAHVGAPGNGAPKRPADAQAPAGDSPVLHPSDEFQSAAPADASPAPARPQVPETLQQVVRAVVDRAEQNGGEARLRLHPENLGEVTIRVHTEGDHVRVEIHADRPEAAQLFREHTVDLSSMLGQQGLNLSEAWVGLGNQQANSGNQGEPQQPPSNRPGTNDFAALMGIGDTAATATHNRLRAAYNPDGAHLYRV